MGTPYEMVAIKDVKCGDKLWLGSTSTSIEIIDLDVNVSGDIAFVYASHHANGTKNNVDQSYFMRPDSRACIIRRVRRFIG